MSKKDGFTDETDSLKEKSEVGKAQQQVKNSTNAMAQRTGAAAGALGGAYAIAAGVTAATGVLFPLALAAGLSAIPQCYAALKNHRDLEADKVLEEFQNLGSLFDRVITGNDIEGFKSLLQTMKQEFSNEDMGILFKRVRDKEGRSILGMVIETDGTRTGTEGIPLSNSKWPDPILLHLLSTRDSDILNPDFVSLALDKNKILSATCGLVACCGGGQVNKKQLLEHSNFSGIMAMIPTVLNSLPLDIKEARLEDLQKFLPEFAAFAQKKGSVAALPVINSTLQSLPKPMEPEEVEFGEYVVVGVEGSSTSSPSGNLSTVSAVSIKIETGVGKLS